MSHYTHSLPSACHLLMALFIRTSLSLESSPPSLSSSGAPCGWVSSLKIIYDPHNLDTRCMSHRVPFLCVLEVGDYF